MDSGKHVANIVTKRTKECRKRVVKSIIDEIIKHGSPNIKLKLPEIVKSAERFEEMANASAKTQDEYLSMVREKLKSIRARSCKTVEVKKVIANPSASEIGAKEDWQKLVYERLQLLKQKYNSFVHKIYEKCCRELKVDPSTKIVSARGLFKHKSELENVLSLFKLSKSQIAADMKGRARKAGEYIQIMLHLIKKHRNKQQFNSIFSQPNTMVSQDHQVAVPIGSSQHGNINQSSIVKGQSNAVQQQTNIALEGFDVNINTPRISETEAYGTRTNSERILPLVKESNNQNQGFHNTKGKGHAMQQLTRVLNSISPEALSAAVGEIEEMVHLNDNIPKMVDELELPIFITRGGWKMPRSFVVTTFDTPSMHEGFNQFTYTPESNLNSFTMKGKHARTVENHNLLAEIKDINNRLFDCEVVIAEKENAKSAVGIATDQSEGLVVKILYNAVTINQNLVSHFTDDKKSLITPLRLLIPASYPSCSLVILDELPLKVSDDLNALSERAKEKLRLNLGKMNEPRLIKDIAKVWERCATEAILEYAYANGGGTFISMHGGWEVC